MAAGAVLALACGAGRAPAGEKKQQPSLEHKVKAGFLYNFVKFVEWPKGAFKDGKNGKGEKGEKIKAPLVIGVAGKNPFRGVLAALAAGKNAGGRPITVKNLEIKYRKRKPPEPGEKRDEPEAGSEPELAEEFVTDLKKCHVLFIPATESSHRDRILAAVRNSAVLTVGEETGFARKGGVVNFYLRRRKVRFEMNPEEARRRKLKISSRLLRLARIVKSRKRD